MKILISLGQRPSPAQRGTGRALRVQRNASGQVAIGTSSSNRRKAVPSAAQEEDRSDVEGADHHGGWNLHRAKAEAIHSFFRCGMDCFAEPVIGRRFAPTCWLAMTADADVSFQIQEYATIPGFPNPLYMINII